MNAFQIIGGLVIIIVVLIVLSTVFTTMIPSSVQQATQVINLLDYVVETQQAPCKFYCYATLNVEEGITLNTTDYTQVTKLPLYFSCNYQLLKVVTLAYEIMDTKIRLLNSCFNDCKQGDDYCDQDLCTNLNDEFPQVDVFDDTQTSLPTINLYEETIKSLINCLSNPENCDDNYNFKKICRGESYFEEALSVELSKVEIGLLTSCFNDCAQCFFNCKEEEYPGCDGDYECCCEAESNCDYAICETAVEQAIGVDFSKFFDYKINPKDYLNDYPYINCLSELTLSDWLSDFTITQRAGGDLNNLECTGSFDACNVQPDKYGESCWPAWQTLLLRKGRCEDVSLLHYTIFRTLGLPDYSTSSQLNTVQLKMGACELPCACKQLISECGLSDDVRLINCEAPSEVIVQPYESIKVCEASVGGTFELTDPLTGDFWIINQRSSPYYADYQLIKSFDADNSNDYYEVRVNDGDVYVAQESTICEGYGQDLSKEDLISKCELFIENPIGFSDKLGDC